MEKSAKRGFSLANSKKDAKLKKVFPFFKAAPGGRRKGALRIRVRQEDGAAGGWN
jgi:hypothetical protein